MKIAVLMSTFNGEHYLEEQLDSIISQNLDSRDCKIEIYIRDDGSSDSTLSLLKKYSIEYKNISVINDEENIGVKLSFFKLVKEVDADFYLLSDQDDIWSNNKIQYFVDIFKNNKTEGMSFGIYSDMWVADKKGKSTGKLLKKGTSKEPSNNKYIEFDELMFSNKVTGASFGFDKLAGQKMRLLSEKIVQQSAMHDEIFAMVIAATGTLFYSSEPLTYYRQHEHNVLGYSGIQRLSILDKFSHLKSIINGDMQLINDVHAITKVFYTEQTDNIEQLFHAKSIFNQYRYLKIAVRRANSQHYMQLIILYLLILMKWNGGKKSYD
ncbi:glycosyltransferase [Leuconostoc gasicomitatum]|uniref:glycosyltransferase n=1 Tax=Leuconostoc gasicomitatum TaxID=115778 RepID=UPI000744B70D|nr:glycosyltransferase [Leuconostoc gasicomitatum]CUR63288.1 Putative rhamnosyltransferase [Leuconostoc gasicomitatum KG16-1]